MRVLFIEDEEKTVKEISSLLEERCAAEMSVARSRDMALKLIDTDSDFDLIVCDLRIPTTDGGLDVSEDHGLRVYDAARQRCPGTPCIFFSGFVSLDNIGSRLAAGPPVDLFGTGELWPLVDVKPKREQPEFLELATVLAAELSYVDTLEIDYLSDLAISRYELRPLRVYARRLSGTRIVASTLGGLSGARVLQCEVFDDSSSSVGVVVAKVHVISDIVDEIDRYGRYVAAALGIGAFAPLAGEVLHGCGQYGAVFYTLAADGYDDLFELSTACTTEAATAIGRLKDALSGWERGGEPSVVSIGELRSARVSDSELAYFADELNSFGRQEVEDVYLSVTPAVQHGDLHGRNVLVDVEGRPVIIDYGDLGLASAVLDPVTLELSLLFHSEHPDLDGWPTLEQAGDWFDLENYVQGSPVGEVVVACREWAMSAGPKLELAAFVYIHAVRQLKYSDTDKGLALAIAKAAVDMIMAIDENRESPLRETVDIRSSVLPTYT